MSRGTNMLGVVFLIVGLGLAVAVTVALVLAQTVTFAGAIALGIGVLCAVLGALFIEPDATKAALGSIGSSVGPYLPFNGQRDHDG